VRTKNGNCELSASTYVPNIDAQCPFVNPEAMLGSKRTSEHNHLRVLPRDCRGSASADSNRKVGQEMVHGATTLRAGTSLAADMWMI
jgi:hypothetical protein